MNYSDEFKVCWYTPQRTATRATATLLKTLDFTSIGSHSFYLPKERLDYRLISNVRNPYPRMVSLFFLYSLHKKNFNLNFYNWCEYVLTNENFDNDYSLRYEKKIKSVGRDFDTFIRVETLSDDLEKLNFINLTKPETKDVWDNSILNNSYTHEFKYIEKDDKKKWEDFYDEKTAKLVYTHLEEQFDFFGYDKNSWNNGTP
jgi:hypothetical protein